MKPPGNSAEKLLDVAFAPEAEALLDELERSGQFRIGVEAELDEADESASNDYLLARGAGNLTVHDWWTSGRVTLRLATGIRPDDVSLARVNDSLVVRTQDGMDRITLVNYLGLIPDASTLQVTFDDGTVWTGERLLSRISSWVAAVAPSASPPNQ